MAIRPTDLQNALIQQVQNPPLVQRAEEGPRQNQLAAQATFVAQTAQRNETIASTGQAQGNRVGERDARRDQDKGEQGERQPGDPFEETVDEASGYGEPPHLIDFSA